MTVNWLAVLGAAVAGFFLGWAWYAALGKPWQRALGWDPEDCKNQKMPLAPLAFAFVADLVMALFLAALIKDLGIEIGARSSNIRPGRRHRLYHHLHGRQQCISETQTAAHAD